MSAFASVKSFQGSTSIHIYKGYDYTYDHAVFLPGPVAQSVTCLATDASLTADPEVMSLIPAWSHTFVEIDHELISMVILLPSAESFKKGCCQFCTKYWLTACSSLSRKKCG